MEELTGQEYLDIYRIEIYQGKIYDCMSDHVQEITLAELLDRYLSQIKRDLEKK